MDKQGEEKKITTTILLEPSARLNDNRFQMERVVQISLRHTLKSWCSQLDANYKPPCNRDVGCSPSLGSMLLEFWVQVPATSTLNTSSTPQPQLKSTKLRSTANSNTSKKVTVAASNLSFHLLVATTQKQGGTYYTRKLDVYFTPKGSAIAIGNMFKELESKR